jgi:hypothetical protein
MAPGTAVQPMRRREFSEVRLRRVSRLALPLVFAAMSTPESLTGKLCRGHRSSAMYQLRTGPSGCFSSELRELAHSWACCPVVTVSSVSIAGAAFTSLAEFLDANDRSMGRARI